MGYEIGRHYTFNSQLLRVDWWNGSITFFRNLEYKPSDPDFHRLGGLELTDAAVDEAQTVSEKAVNILASRIRHMVAQYDLPTSLLLTCNPGPHWVKHKFIKTPEGEPVELAPHLTHIQAMLTDNPDKKYVAGYMAQLQTMSEYDKARLLYGDWDAEERTGGEFYADFHTEQNVMPAPYDPERPLHLTFDFNVHPYITLCVWQMNGRTAWQLTEYCLRHPKNRTRDACSAFMQDFSAHSAGLFVYGDPAGRHEDTRSEQGHNDYSLAMRELAKLKPQMRVARRAPSVAMRGQFINALFSGKIQDCTVFISPTCRETIKDYQNVKQAADGGKEKKKVRDPDTGVSYEPLGHTSDANDYFMCWVYGKEYDHWQSNGQAFRAKLGRRRDYGKKRF